MSGCPAAARPQALSIRRISRVVSDCKRAESFYGAALGFRTVSRAPLAAGELRALGAGGMAAEEVVMRLGAEQIALVQFDAPGRPYPADSRSDDAWFQHLALIAADMDAAYARLRAAYGWRAISAGGPQTLPAANGGGSAFKFRDPDGHPLELRWLAPGKGRDVWRGRPLAAGTLGIDHSALAVRDARRSLSFYAGLGFRLTGHSRNRGPAQSHLDGLPHARVLVSALRPASADGPGLELLAYRPPGRCAAPTNLNDFSTDWVTLQVTGPPAGTVADAEPLALADPDGHRLLLIPSGASTVRA